MGGLTKEDGTNVDRVTLEDVAECLCDLRERVSLLYSYSGWTALTAISEQSKLGELLLQPRPP